MHDTNAINGNGNGGVAPAHEGRPDGARPEEARSLEALLFHGGLITADQLDELAREQAATGAPVEELLRRRAWVQPEVLERLLGRTQAATRPFPQPEGAQPVAQPHSAPPPHPQGAFTAPIELVPAQVVPMPTPLAPVEPAPAPVQPAPVQPAPVEPASVEPAPVEAAPVDAAPVGAAPPPPPAPVAHVVEPAVDSAVETPAHVVEMRAAHAPVPVEATAPVASPVASPAAAAAPTRRPEAAADPDGASAPDVTRTLGREAPDAVPFDVIVRLTDGYELVASRHASLREAEAAARVLPVGAEEWLDFGDALVQRTAVAAIIVRPRLSRQA